MGAKMKGMEQSISSAGIMYVRSKVCTLIIIQSQGTIHGAIRDQPACDHHLYRTCPDIKQITCR